MPTTWKVVPKPMQVDSVPRGYLPQRACPCLLGCKRRRLKRGTSIETKYRSCCEAPDEANSERGKMMEDRWLSVDEIAEHLGIKRDTVYKWISERQMPGHKIGRLWKFNKQEIDEWVRSGGANTSLQESETSEDRKRES